jgi:hypothetical protein
MRTNRRFIVLPRSLQAVLLAGGPGLVTQEIDASRIMWEFFEDFRRPAR